MSTRRLPRNIQQQQKAISDAEAALLNPNPAPAIPDPDPAPAGDPPQDPPPADDPGTPPPQDPPTPNQGEEYWRGRFQTVEGVLRKERDERKAEQQATQAQLTNLQKQVEQLQQQRDPVADVDLTQHFTQEQIDQYGADHLRSVLRAAQRTLQPQLKAALDSEMAPLREEIAQTRQSMQQSQQNQAKSAYDAFLAEVSKQVPNWEQVNADPRFHQYLHGVDETTGDQRQTLLATFEQRRDAGRVARIFKDYLKTQGAKPQNPDPSRRQLPTGAGNGGGDPPPAAPMVTQAEIRQFQADVSRGRYRGRAKEQAEMQKKIDDAYAAGRIG